MEAVSRSVSASPVCTHARLVHVHLQHPPPPGSRVLSGYNLPTINNTCCSVHRSRA